MELPESGFTSEAISYPVRKLIEWRQIQLASGGAPAALITGKERDRCMMIFSLAAAVKTV
jgi:hypothetical protein